MKRFLGIEIPRTHEGVCLHRTALLVYDMQVGILRQLKESERIIENARAVLEAARECNSSNARKAAARSSAANANPR
jgi:biuret amidohydrolase